MVPQAANIPTKTEADGRKLQIGSVYLVSRPNSTARRATVVNLRNGVKGVEAYVSFEGADKRLDSWVDERDVGVQVESPTGKRGRGVFEASHSKETNGMVVETNKPLGNPVETSPSAPSTPEREHAQITRVRNYEDVRMGMYLIKTWYYSPYPKPVEEKPEQTVTPISSNSAKKRKVEHETSSPVDKAVAQKNSPKSNGDVFATVRKGGEGAKGRLWVCDLCFKYMQTRDGWTRHVSSCTMYTPPGREVYQKGSYRIWEIDGAQEPLYCQNLSLFGKLFIDHKSVFFHVENFLFYAICDASTSKHDHVMAFFSKEKLSYDDNNLACIVTFPPCQNRGFGKLLIEFSYYLTQHPSTRSANGSPGTPERPLSDLGLKGYTAYWVSTVLRVCRRLLADAPPIVTTPKKVAPVVGRPRRHSRASATNQDGQTVCIDGVDVIKIDDTAHKGQYAISMTMSELAKICHIRIDDMAFTLSELGFLKHRREPMVNKDRLRRRQTLSEYGVAGDDHERDIEEGHAEDQDLGEWNNVEVVITKGMVDEQWEKWRVKEKGVLDESCVSL